MPYYRAPSLREVLMQHLPATDKNTACLLAKATVRKVATALYSITPDDSKRLFDRYEERITNYTNDVHLQRFRQRAGETRRLTQYLRLLVEKSPSAENHSADDIDYLSAITEILDSKSACSITYRVGGNYRNERWNNKRTVSIEKTISVLEQVLNGGGGKKEGVNELVKTLTPPRLWLIHGDLHLSNILMDLNSIDDPVFKLIDPNVQLEGGDIAYDLGKLYHSFDGLYDFMDEGLLDIRIVEQGKNNKGENELRIDLEVGVGAITKELPGGGSGAEITCYVETAEQVELYQCIAKEFENFVEEIRAELGKDVIDINWKLRHRTIRSGHPDPR